MALCLPFFEKLPLWINDNKILFDLRKLSEIAAEIEKSESAIVETRNPLLINYFSDDFAVEHCAVWNADLEAYVQVFDGGDIEKLKAMGPGEVLADKKELNFIFG